MARTKEITLRCSPRAARVAAVLVLLAGCGGGGSTPDAGGPSMMDGATGDRDAGAGEADAVGADAGMAIAADSLCITTARAGTMCTPSSDLTVSRTVDSGVVRMSFTRLPFFTFEIRVPDGASAPHEIREVTVVYDTELHCDEATVMSTSCVTRRDFDVSCGHVVDDTRLSEVRATAIELSPSHLRAVLHLPLDASGSRPGGRTCGCMDECAGASVLGMYTLYTDVMDVTIDVDF